MTKGSEVGFDWCLEIMMQIIGLIDSIAFKLMLNKAQALLRAQRDDTEWICNSHETQP